MPQFNQLNKKASDLFLIPVHLTYVTTINNCSTICVAYVERIVHD